MMSLSLVLFVLLAAPVETPEAAVRGRVQAFGEAFRNGDVQTVEGLLAKHYSHCNSDGSRPDKQQWLACNRQSSMV